MINTVQLFTIGHGNRDLAAFMDLLRDNKIKILVDIRARPASGRFPHFNQESLRAACDEVGLAYHSAGRHFGGFRKAKANSPHTALESKWRGFADHMDTPGFARGIAQLRNLASGAPTAIMCAEIDPRHCHRRLIADFLILSGVDVWHIVSGAPPVCHQLDAAARRESARLVYDRFTQGRLC